MIKKAKVKIVCPNPACGKIKYYPPSQVRKHSHCSRACARATGHKGGRFKILPQQKRAWINRWKEIEEIECYVAGLLVWDNAEPSIYELSRM